MSDTSGGLGWWQASDGKWYPPERHPDADWRHRYAFDEQPTPSPEPVPPRSRNRWLVPVAIIAVVALLAAGATYLLAGNDDDSGGDQAATDAGPITLEAANSPGADPFTTDLTVHEIAAQPDAIDAVTALQTDLPTDELTGTLIATGTTPGLYGGTTDDQACDPTQLTAFLTDPANTDKAQAWAQAQNIPTDNIEDFVNALTPVVLTTDTWVTNHGYRNGRATDFQAILQAGTAVLVDDTGTPRVKCSCGNPLQPARPDGTDPGHTTGTPWDGYDPATTTIVDPGNQTDTLTLTDLQTGDPLEQPIGGDADLSTVDWANFTYPAESCPVVTDGPTFTLTDGEYQEAPDPAIASYRSGWLDEVLYGDLTGDGSEEAVVMLTCSGGGTGIFTSASVFTAAADGPELLQTISPAFSDRGHTGTTIIDGAIQFDGLLPGPNDGLCCPTIPTTELWRWNGTAFVQE